MTSAQDAKIRAWLDEILDEYRRNAEESRDDLRATRALSDRINGEILYVPGTGEYREDQARMVGVSGMVRGMVVGATIWDDYDPKFRALRSELHTRARPPVAVAWSGHVRFSGRIKRTFDDAPADAQTLLALRHVETVLEDIAEISLADELSYILDEESPLSALVRYDEDERCVFLSGQDGPRVLAIVPDVRWAESGAPRAELRFDLSRSPTPAERAQLLALGKVVWTRTRWAEYRDDLVYKPDDELADDPYSVEYDVADAVLETVD